MNDYQKVIQKIMKHYETRAAECQDPVECIKLLGVVDHYKELSEKYGNLENAPECIGLEAGSEKTA